MTLIRFVLALGGVLNSYQKYYNEARMHLSLHKDVPISRASSK